MRPRHPYSPAYALTEPPDAPARKPGSSKSAIVADALRSYLARRGTKELDDLLKTRLDRISRQLGRIERDQQVLLETLALFVRYQLTVTAPLPEADQAAARALGQERFQAFIDQVGRRLADGRTVANELLARDLAEEGGPDRKSTRLNSSH